MAPVEALNVKKAQNGFTNEMLKYTYPPKTIDVETTILLCSNIGVELFTFAVHCC